MSELVAAPTATHPIHKCGQVDIQTIAQEHWDLYRAAAVHTPRSSGPRVSGCRGASSSYFLMFLVVPVRGYNSYIQHMWPRRRASRRVAESPPLTVLLAAANWRRQEWGEFQNEHRRSETLLYR